jgi:type II secretory ATPase GspE/PulE/Tfp pilus assembly ATPase PilB-like protein
VFSTLHTNDAVGAIPRLLDLGVPDYLVAATVDAVLAQRLVRRICDDCREDYAPNPDRVALVAGQPVSNVTLQRGRGCSVCRGTGFRGRLGVFELFIMSDAIRDAVSQRATRGTLRALAVDEGMLMLRADGWAKVQAGLTTIEEVLRATHD